MAKPRPPQLVEKDFEEYLGQRIDQLGLPCTIDDLRTSVIAFENSIGLVDIQANVLLVLGASTLFVAGTAIAIIPAPGMGELALIATFGLAAFLLLTAGFRRGKWTRYLDWGGLRPLACTEQPHIDDLLHEVDAGSHTVMRIAKGGAAAAATPVSHRPADLVIGKDCLADRRLAATLFGSASVGRQFVAIVPEATGEWFNYYFWHPPVADHLLDLFDRTKQIYAGDTVKREKVRIALRTISESAAKRRLAHKAPPPKDVVVTAFAQALKAEAARLLAEGAITPLEQAQLCRLNITGEPGSDDPAASGNRGRKPESWFVELMGGRYAPVTRPLSETIQDELNVAPRFTG